MVKILMPSLLIWTPRDKSDMIDLKVKVGNVLPMDMTLALEGVPN